MVIKFLPIGKEGVKTEIVDDGKKEITMSAIDVVFLAENYKNSPKFRKYWDKLTGIISEKNA